MNASKRGLGGWLGVLIVAVALSGCVQRDAASVAPQPAEGRRVDVPTLDRKDRLTAQAVTLPGPLYDPGTTREPTIGGTHNLLWHHDGSWWGLLVTEGGLRVHRLVSDASLPGPDMGWIDTGTLVDERPKARSDVLVDGDLLYVIGAGTGSGQSQAARLTRFAYDREAGHYVRDPNFPITLTDRGVTSPTITKDAAGMLWVAYVIEGQLFAAHSDGQDELWTPPSRLQADETLPLTADPRDQVSIVTFGKGVGIVWPGPRDGILQFYVQHADDGQHEWRLEQVPIDAAAAATGPLVVGAAKADPDGRVFVPLTVPRDVLEQSGADAPNTMLAVRESDGSWTNYLVAQARDRLSDPIVLVDAGKQALHVIATERTGRVVRKSSDLTRIRFDPGPGSPFITNSERAVVTVPTSTKQPLSSSGTGLVVIASEEGSGRYLYGVLHEGGLAAVAARPAAGTAATAGELLYETFDPWPVGTAPAGWRVRSRDGSGNIVVTEGNAQDRYASVFTEGPAGAPVRACKEFSPVMEGILTVMISFMVDVIPPSDLTVTSLRGDGEAVGVRVDDDAWLVYLEGPEKVRTLSQIRPGIWYRSTVTADLGTRTYAWEVAERDGGDAFTQHSGLPWETPDAGEIDDVCVRTAGGVPGLALHVDDVVVRR